MTAPALRISAAAHDPDPTVSVVIPTFRRDDLLERALRSVCQQRYPWARLEIVVVDDACSPTTGAIVQRVADEFGVRARALSGRRRGPASARNIGWRAASGDVIAFLDDDAYPATPGWLSAGIGPLSGPGVVAVSGRVRVPLPARPTDFQRNVARLESAEFLTCNAFCRRSTLEAVGGFDERFTVPFREDSDLQFRLEQRGRIVREQDAVVIHPAPPGRFAASLRLQRYSMFNALMRKKHPARFSELGASAPVHYYASCAALLASVGALATGHRRSAAAAGLLWLGLTLRLFTKRTLRTSRAPRHVADMALTSILIPPLSVYWRLRGAVRFRVLFV